MKSVAAFSTLLAYAAAQTTYFGVISSRSASPIHLLPLQANGGKFFLGGTASGYCPSEAIGDETCAHYPGNSTTFAGGDVSLSLGVVVPGGQQVYVAPDGTLSYTQAHSAFVPEGSVRTGWNKTERNDGSNLGSLSFEGGLVACPRNETQPWQVYGQIENFTAPEGCLGFGAVTYTASDAAAWQY
ncbi:hypothetical protein DPSP01_000457 [Paraphaeosphaeria sporulosa]|uniref:IgE-binding protein n=1 Tax=Paraphaeosphaeria sporulosa TaxID=1460663 RepID=A0A177C7E5_9PLEO|nr:uncharacterized protein CC84DRAFT_1177556 [Paraphaeosphaeria sporulosa]OAG03563.1 hypothetical protein CC84DRAFT_1177556 [Paraphaeosphaeria sporulosa]